MPSLSQHTTGVSKAFRWFDLPTDETVAGETTIERAMRTSAPTALDGAVAKERRA